MTDTFARWLIETKVITYSDLGRMTKEWSEHRASRDWSMRMFDFTDYLKQQFPDQWLAYRTYIRIINKDT